MDGADAPQWLRDAFQGLATQQAEIIERMAALEAAKQERARTSNDASPLVFTPLENNEKRPKARLPNPDKFDGTDLAAYSQFEGTLRAKLAFDGLAIGGESERIWYAFGRLTGSAAVRIYPWMESAQLRGAFSVEGLFEQMRTAFQDPRRKQKALADLNRVKQGSRPLNDFLAKFDQMILEAQAWSWDDDTKKACLKAALSTKLVLAMVGIPENESYEGYCSQLRMTSDQMEEAADLTARSQAWKKRRTVFADQDRQKQSSQHEDKMDWQPTVSTAATRAKDPRWGSSDEVARRRREGLCLRCGKEDHRVRDCKTKLKQLGEKPVQAAPARVGKRAGKPEEDSDDGTTTTPEDSGKE